MNQPNERDWERRRNPEPRGRDGVRYEFDPDRSIGIHRGGRRYQADEAYGGRDEELPSDYDRGERWGTERYPENPYGAGDSVERSNSTNPPGRWTGPARSYANGSPRPAERESSYSAVQGQFTGKGPKNYKRSDARIEEEVNEVLSRHPDLDATDIEVQVQDGVVNLGGSVAERQFKRMAEDAAEQCSGVQDIRNEIRVQRASGRTENSGSSPQPKKSTAAARG